MRPLTVRIPETLYDRVTAMAARTKRNVPQFVELLLEQGLDRMKEGGSGAATQ